MRTALVSLVVLVILGACATAASASPGLTFSANSNQLSSGAELTAPRAS